MRKPIRIFAVLFAAGLPDLAIGQQDAVLATKGDPAIQAQIRAVFDAKSEPDICQQLEKLTGVADDKAELVRQLAIFSVTAPNREEFHDLLTLRILNRLELPSSIPIRVLARMALELS